MAVPRRREETKRLALPGGGDKTIAVSRGERDKAMAAARAGRRGSDDSSQANGGKKR